MSSSTSSSRGRHRITTMNLPSHTSVRSPLPQYSVIPFYSGTVGGEDSTPSARNTNYQSLNTDARTCQDVIIEFGYPYEAIRVITADGYVLLLERIPRKDARKAVYLQHGVFDSSMGLMTLVVFLVLLSLFSRTCIPWLFKLMIRLSSQTNELYQLASVAFCLLVAWWLELWDGVKKCLELY